METMSVEQVLEITVNNLNSIKIPIGLMDEVGAPIIQSINNLKACIEAIRVSREEAETAVTEDEI